MNAGRSGPDWSLRLAADRDVPALEALIPASVRALQAAYYSREQMEAALGGVFGVDRQLIRDGTYFVAEQGGQVVGCGGWSRRSSLCGGDQGRPAEDPPLDPRLEPARIRAFFVHPDWARRGIGRALIAACERAIVAAGFHRAVVLATLAGEGLYASCGYAESERGAVEMAGGLRLPVVRMAKSLSGPPQAAEEP